MILGKQKFLNGKITISRQGKIDDDDKMVISIEDSNSSLRVIEIELSLENFARAITNLAFVDCSFVMWGNSDLIGKKMEVKYETVDMGKSFRSLRDNEESKKIVRDAISKFEVEGWIGNDSDSFNWHNHVSKTEYSYKILFRRWL